MKLLDISILIPCFNASSTIKRCVNSILQQNYPIDKIKIICIDDGSTDNT
jgi:hyaluronan synthase